MATGTSVIYGKEAPELQLRKMADLYFMLKLYKHAYNHYHTAKKDFQVNHISGHLFADSSMNGIYMFLQVLLASK